MATDLTFGSFTICDVSEGDVYNLVAQNVYKCDTKDIVYPNTAGREIRVIGTRNTDETSDIFTFEGFIFSTTQPGLYTIITNAESYMGDEDNLIQTLAFATPNDGGTAQSETGMRMIDFTPTTPPIYRATNLYYMGFTATFVKYEV